MKPRRIATQLALCLCLLAAVSCNADLKQRLKEKAKYVVHSAQTAVAEAAPARPRTASQAPKIPLGMNLSGVVYYSTAIPFVDGWKAADSFHSLNANFVPGGKNPWDTGFANKIPRDEDGYPLELPYVVPGAEAPQILIAPIAARIYGGRYTLMYDGDGEIEFPNANARITPLGPGKVAVDVQGDGASWFLQIKRSNPKNHIRNIRLYLPGFDGSDPKQVFHPDFLLRLRAASTLRFMDWGHTNNSEIVHWKDRATTSMPQGTWRGVAVEYMVDLANEIEADAWITVPHKADDHYVSELAKLVKQRLHPRRRVYVEYSNEIWNGMFQQQSWSAEQGCKAGLNELGVYQGPCEGGPQYWSAIKWNARRSGEVFEIFRKVFGGTDRIVRVVSGQAAFTHSNENLLDSFYNPKINKAGGQVDALAIAPYFAQGLGGKLGKSPERATITVPEIARRMSESIGEEVLKRTAENKKLADRYGARLIAYEAGQHLIPEGEANRDEPFVQKLVAANRDRQMQEAYAKMIDAWLGASGNDLMMLFVYIERPSKYGSWGMLESQVQPTQDAPKFLGYLDALQKVVAPQAQ